MRDGNLAALDVDNLLEELEDMGRSEKRSVYSNLKILLLHLLKYQYQPAMRSNSWLGRILGHRQRLNQAFKDSPSLKPYYVEIFVEAYGEARELAAAETGMDIGEFPVEVPFSAEEVLRSGYFAISAGTRYLVLTQPPTLPSSLILTQVSSSFTK